MSVFEKAVTEVRQGQEAFHNNLNNTNNSPPERDITYFNRTLVSVTTFFGNTAKYTQVGTVAVILR